MKYKDIDELAEMSSKELITYRNKMALKAIKIKEGIKEFGSAWGWVNEELREKLETLEYEMIEIEQDRLNAVTCIDFDQLQLH